MKIDANRLNNAEGLTPSRTICYRWGLTPCISAGEELEVLVEAEEEIVEACFNLELSLIHI